MGAGVIFRNGSPFDTEVDDLPDGLATGEYAMRGNGPVDPPCTATPDDDPTKGWMEFVDAADLPGGLPTLDDEVHLFLRPFDAFDVTFECTTDSHPGVSLARPFGDDAHYDDGTVKFGSNPFDIAFSLPREALGMGYIEQLIPIQAFEGERCPHYGEYETTKCRLAWQAKIKFTKLWEKPIDATATPTPTATSTPAPVPPAAPDDDWLVPLVPAPAPDDDDWLVPLVPAAKASLSSNARKASFSVACAGGCTGTATLTAGTGPGARAAKARKPLAKTSFKVAKGRTRRVTLKLGGKARRAVKRAGGARVVVRTRAGGKTTTTTLKLRLKFRR